MKERFIPGEVISCDDTLIKGHNTHLLDLPSSIQNTEFDLHTEVTDIFTNEEDRISENDIERISQNDKERISENNKERISENNKERISENNKDRIYTNNKERIFKNEKERIFKNDIERIFENNKDRISQNDKERIYTNNKERISENNKDRISENNKDRDADVESVSNYIPGGTRDQMSFDLASSESKKIIVSSVYGVPILQQKLLTCYPVYNLKYLPQIGDVLVGRIVKISDKRWFVDLNSSKQGVLLLNSVDISIKNQNMKCKNNHTINATNSTPNAFDNHTINATNSNTNVFDNHMRSTANNSTTNVLNNHMRNSNSSDCFSSTPSNRKMFNEDAIRMRELYSINDLIVCEVNKVGHYINVQTRSIISHRNLAKGMNNSTYFEGRSDKNLDNLTVINSSSRVCSSSFIPVNEVISANRRLLGGFVLVGNPLLILKSKNQIYYFQISVVILGLNGVVWFYSQDPKVESRVYNYIKGCFKNNTVLEVQNIQEVIERRDH